MIDPNIKKKADDIRNKVYGKEVRESLASGLEAMSSDVVETVGRQDDVESQWQNVVDETTGKDVISAPEIIAARDGEVNLKARLDKEKNEVTAQLAQNASGAIDIKKVYGATGNGIDSDVQAIINGSQSNTKLFFPSGTYVIDSHTVIKDIKNMVWVSGGDVTILDTCQEVTSFDNTKDLTPFGLRFENCTIEFEGNFIHDNAAIKTIDKRVSDGDKHKIVPCLDFYECNVRFTVGIEGISPPWYSPSPNVDPNTQGAFETMVNHYVRFYDCDNVFLSSEVLSGAGAGEVFGATKVKNLVIDGVKYFQKNAEYSFWSLAKVIDCEDIRIKGIRAQSKSSGSFIDVAGNNIVYEDINIDYPNGKLIDVTNEWGYNNVPIGTIKIKNCESNGRELVFTSVADRTNLQPTEKLIIDNVRQKDSSRVLGYFVNNSFVKDTTIKNCTIKNYAYVNTMSMVVTNEIIEEHQDTLISNCKITSDITNTQQSVLIETKGTTTVVNTLINLNRSNQLQLRERRNELDDIADLRDSDYKIIIKNAIIKDTEINLQANVEFIDCEIINCDFTSSSAGDTRRRKPSVKFINTPIHFDNVGNNQVGNYLINASSEANTFGDISFVNSSITGRTREGLFRHLQEKADNITFKNSTIDVERWETDRSAKRELSALVVFGVYDNTLSNAKLFIDKSKIKGTVMRFTGGSSTENNVITILDSVFFNTNASGNKTYAFSFEGGSVDSITFVLVKSIFNHIDPRGLSDKDFKLLRSNGNADDTPVNF